MKKEMLRYALVTPFIGLTDLGVYFLLIRFLPHSVAKGFSYIIANGTGYLFNKYWIFKRKHKQAAAPEAGRYVIVDVVLFAANVGINHVMLAVSHNAVFLSIATASLITLLLSFTFKKFWVFKTSSV